MVAHKSNRTTGFYDRRSDQVSLGEITRIAIKSTYVTSTILERTGGSFAE